MRKIMEHGTTLNVRSQEELRITIYDLRMTIYE